MAGNPQQPAARSVFPPLGLLAVLLGAMIATFFGRLPTVGVSDLRGALHLDYDAATWITTAAAMFSQASTSDFAFGRAAELLGLTVRKQAYTLAITDCFWVIAFSALLCLFVVACIRSLDIQYKHVIAAARRRST
ncbi:MAG TPA: hypothetical protein VNW54_03860 [Granulicella sp.]|jgi:hypothetical protein|nr:hypothetical protein [Granulicella sp.]